MCLLVQLSAILQYPCTLCRQPSLSQMLLRSQTFFRIGVTLTGFASLLAGCTSRVASNPPAPKPTLISFTDADLKNYAKAVLAIEPVRQAAYNEIQQMSKNGQAPDIVCDQSKSLERLSKDIQTVAINYCTQSKKISESNGLTMAQFNALSVNVQSDPELQRRIQNELIRLQQ